MRQTMKVLHSTDGVLNKNTHFCELAIFFLLIIRQFRKRIPFRFSRLFMALWDLPWHYSDAKTISYMVYLLILCLHKENYAIS
jgi:hypothetical protein